MNRRSSFAAAAVLAGMVRQSAWLLPAARQGWAEALLAEADEVPAGASRAAWLCGGLWMVTREVVMGRVIQILAFAAGVTGMVWVGWPGPGSDSAMPANRTYIIATIVLLAALPLVVHRYFGPARRGWAPVTARVGGYALVFALVAAKNTKDRFGSRLGGHYFTIDVSLFSLGIVLLLVIAAYVAGLLILTSQRMRFSRPALPVALGFGALAAGGLYEIEPLTSNPWGPSLLAWVVTTLVLAAVTGFLVARLAARDTRSGMPNPVQQGTVAATCAVATAALLVSVLTSVLIALFPHRVPLQIPTSGGVCQTCNPARRVIPPSLRHEYRVEISVGQAGETPLLAIMLAPLLGGAAGAIAAGLASRSRGGIGVLAEGLRMPPGGSAAMAAGLPPG
jgi:hypothetical protein